MVTLQIGEAIKTIRNEQQVLIEHLVQNEIDDCYLYSRERNINYDNLKTYFFISHYLQQATCYPPKILKVGQAVKANFSNNCPSGNPKIYFLHLDQ